MTGAVASSVAILAGITERILALPPGVALAIVFALPALESSAFLGFLFPGELAVILGGVLASQGRISLGAAIAAAVLGAVVGDSVGYLIGRRWGRRLLHGTLGRLPVIRDRLDRHLDTAQEYVRRRRGRAVFFGRFTAALRVLVPGLAGMSDVHYPTFLFYNVAGGVVWGAGFVLVGYAAGESYHVVERVAGRIGLGLLAVIVVGLVLSRVVRALRARSERIQAMGDRLAATPPLAWIRRRFPGRVGWTRRRLEPGTPTGFALTFSVVLAGLGAWIFGALTQDVVQHDEAALLDPRVEAFVLAHRTGLLTGVMKAVTWLGSTAVIVPALLVIGGAFVLRRRRWLPGALLAAAVAGAVVLYDVVKPVVERPRPPASTWIGLFSGWAFPSGHATQSVAFYGMLAIVLSAGRPVGVQARRWAVAAGLVLLVGASRIYLGGHWLTDVLGGFALGAAWVAFVVAIALRRGGAGIAAWRGRRASADPRVP